MIPVTAAGGVLYRRKDKSINVLLIYRNEVWDLPKGKQEEGETIEDCARREVAEETGIPLPEVEHFLMETRHVYERNGQHYSKTTHWYQMRITKEDVDFSPQRQEGIEQVEWVELEKARRIAGFENLVDVLDALEGSIK